MKTQITSLVLGLASLFAPLAAWADTKGDCQQQTFPGDQHEFACALKASASAQRYRFAVKLSGSHDDSSSTLAVQIDQVAVPCEAGSKVASDAEDGEVVMVCRFTLPASSKPEPRALLATLKAVHVFIDAYTLTAE